MSTTPMTIAWITTDQYRAPIAAAMTLATPPMSTPVTCEIAIGRQASARFRIAVGTTSKALMTTRMLLTRSTDVSSGVWK